MAEREKKRERDRERVMNRAFLNTEITLLENSDILWLIYISISNVDKMTHFMHHSVTSQPNVHKHSPHKVLWTVYVYVKL